jgi:hypothetical protein
MKQIVTSVKMATLRPYFWFDGDAKWTVLVKHVECEMEIQLDTYKLCMKYTL